MISRIHYYIIIITPSTRTIHFIKFDSVCNAVSITYMLTDKVENAYGNSVAHICKGSMYLLCCPRIKMFWLIKILFRSIEPWSVLYIFQQTFRPQLWRLPSVQVLSTSALVIRFINARSILPAEIHHQTYTVYKASMFLMDDTKKCT